ncbi:MAG: ribonuclease P protein component [Buchnera aphidicola (Floraphis choui)]
MKLLTSTDFENVFNNSNKVKYRGLIILKCVNTLAFPRLGISISQKYVQNSYKRNRIKRIIREKFRLIQYKLINADFIVIINSRFININYTLLKKNLDNLWAVYYQ